MAESVNKRIVIAFLLMVMGGVNVNGQNNVNLTVFCEDQNITVSISNSPRCNVTALQFLLTLPSGVSLNDEKILYSKVKGGAVLDHDVVIEKMDSLNYLIIVYSISLAILQEGSLITLPIQNAIGSVEEGMISSILMCSDDGKVDGLDDVCFQLSIDTQTVIRVTNGKREQRDGNCTFNLQGWKCSFVGSGTPGIYIHNGKKILKK